MARASQEELRRGEGERGPEKPESGAAAPWQVRLTLLAAIWGLSFVFIKVGDEVFAPMQLALVRLSLGTATLLTVLAVRRERLPRKPGTWGHLSVSALLGSAAPFTLFAYGETHVTSIAAGIWNATTPLVTVLVSMLMLPGERPTRERVAGLAIGFLGVLVVLGIWTGVGSGELLGSIACFGAATCYGIGFPYTRKYLAGLPESTVSLVAAQLVCGTAEVAIVTPFVTSTPHSLPLKVVACMIGLGVFGTGIAYIINYSLIREVGATIASTVTYLVPLFATLAGVTILGEPLTWNEPIGALIVILGVALTQGRFHGILARAPQTVDTPDP